MIKTSLAFLIFLYFSTSSFGYSSAEENLLALRHSQNLDALQENASLKILHNFWSSIWNFSNASIDRLQESSLPISLPIFWKLNGVTVKTFPLNHAKLINPKDGILLITPKNAAGQNSLLFESLSPSIAWIRMHEVFANLESTYAMPTSYKRAFSNINKEASQSDALLKDSKYYNPDSSGQEFLFLERERIRFQISELKEQNKNFSPTFQFAQRSYREYRDYLLSYYSIENGWTPSQISMTLENDAILKEYKLKYLEALKVFNDLSSQIRILEKQQDELGYSYAAHGKKLQQDFESLGFSGNFYNLTEIDIEKLQQISGAGKLLSPDQNNSFWKKIEQTKSRLQNLKSEFSVINQTFISRCSCSSSKIPELLMDNTYQNFRNAYVALAAQVRQSFYEIRHQSTEALRSIIITASTRPPRAPLQSTSSAAANSRRE